MMELLKFYDIPELEQKKFGELIRKQLEYDFIEMGFKEKPKKWQYQENLQWRIGDTFFTREMNTYFYFKMNKLWTNTKKHF